MTEENTSETIDPKICGVAALFNKAELKSPLNVMRQIPFLAPRTGLADHEIPPAETEFL